MSMLLSVYFRPYPPAGLVCVREVVYLDSLVTNSRGVLIAGRSVAGTSQRK